MEDYKLLYFLAGVVIGWLTKAPWFLKEYKKWEEETRRIHKWMEHQEWKKRQDERDK